MEEQKEEREMREFSWSNLFLVTGCCFLAFAGFMKLVEGSVHPIFLRIGVSCLFFWLLSCLFKWLVKKIPARKQGHSPGEFL